ncbi:hypothetical protein KSP35_02130 [Aquihabitans sp. G128]|uniref:hypothetical protein n=1 Tax=Aquihabitans sp. G128 TaxID=2849779 RepID=UPI001C23AA3B|nr:hypothetical protein [Aquihabitans sp. G128]QXC61669.1 hypothetical protein KSP35_02130 [Aquihabitans sp. G128]
MAIEIETKDCTALGDAELAELADLCADGPSRFEIGVLSKAAESWVLVTLARENGRLYGFSFSTLERIGGTPSVIVGLASIKRTAKRDTVLRAIVHDQLRRAVLAFPDEDVLIGTRFASVSGYDAFKALQDIVPRPDYVATGEERAWGRRLVKRFGIASSRYDERSFVVKGDDSYPEALDHDSLKPEKLEGYAQFFGPVNAKRGDALIAFGWAMADDLVKLA